MAGLLFKKNKKIFNTALLAVLLMGCVFSAQNAMADYYFDNFSVSDYTTPFTTPFASDFSGNIPLRKKELTPEQKETIRLAKEKMAKKKLQFSDKEFIKQIKKNKIKNVELMLEAGMSPNTDYFGEYALFYAVKYNKTDIALLLLEKGANPNTGFDSSLLWATKNNNKTLVSALVKNGVKVDYTDLVSSKTVLYTALKQGYIDIARILIENGAKIDNYSAAIIDKRNLYDTLGVER